VINMELKKINWFGLVGGILLIVVLAVSIFYPWWQLLVGESLMEVNVSPMNTNFGLLGTSFTIPVIWALNITSVLTFLTSGIIMLIYAVMPMKSYSKDLLGFAYRKPIYAVVFAVIGLLIVTFMVQSIFSVNIPLVGTSTIALPSSLMGGNASVKVLISTAFVWPFWLAIAAAALCLAARIYHIKLTPKQASATNTDAQAAPDAQPATTAA
jgi:hypothetical protein